MAASTALTIEAVQVRLALGVGALFKEELKAAGLKSGMFFIGAVARMPESAYLLWHLQGEVPVSTLVPIAATTDLNEARKAVQDFILKWQRREG